MPTTTTKIMSHHNKGNNKIKRITNLFTTNSIEDLTNKTVDTLVLRKRTKSQTQLLALPTTSNETLDSSSNSLALTSSTSITSSNSNSSGISATTVRSPSKDRQSSPATSSSTTKYPSNSSLSKTNFVGSVTSTSPTSSYISSRRKAKSTSNEASVSSTAAATPSAATTAPAVRMKIQTLNNTNSPSPRNNKSDSPTSSSYHRDRSAALSANREQRKTLDSFYTNNKVPPLSDTATSSSITLPTESSAATRDIKTNVDTNSSKIIDRTEAETRVLLITNDEDENRSDNHHLQLSSNIDRRAGDGARAGNTTESNENDDSQAKLLTSDLQLASRVVFFDDSGVSLHGTIRFIGTFDDVIHAGIELVSLTKLII